VFFFFLLLKSTKGFNMVYHVYVCCIVNFVEFFFYGIELCDCKVSFLG